MWQGGRWEEISHFNQVGSYWENEERTCGKEEGGRKFPTLIKLDHIGGGGGGGGGGFGGGGGGGGRGWGKEKEKK